MIYRFFPNKNASLSGINNRYLRIFSNSALLPDFMRYVAVFHKMAAEDAKND